MALGLNKSCKDRLKEKLTEALPKVVVEKNYFITWASKYYFKQIEIILPQRGAVKDKLDKYIGDDSFSEFAFEFLSRQLKSVSEYKADEQDKLLKDLPAFNNLSELASEIVEAFDSLPWKYSASIPLYDEISELFAKEIKEYVLSDFAKLIIPDDDLISTFPFKTLDGKEGEIYEKPKGFLNMLLPKRLEWNTNKVYINFVIEGFIREYGYTSTYENLIDQIKAFFGLGIALRLFEVKYKYRQVVDKVNIIFHKNYNENWHFEETISLESDISERIADLVISDLDGVLDIPEKKTVWLIGALNNVGVVFSNTIKAEKILLAAKWYFESYIGINELLSFIQCNVALEILLGDKASSDLVGIGELMSNRCAYLIGKSRQGRESILKEFKHIYAIRSSIVHSGKSRLSQTERYAFYKLQWMCRRVIFEEIELLKRDLIKK